VDAVSKFSKEHYEDVAKVVLECHELYDGVPDGPQAVGAHLVLYRVAEALAEHFAEDNERFNRQVFKDACESGLELATEFGPIVKGVPNEAEPTRQA
jgi:hypothetical protein